MLWFAIIVFCSITWYYVNKWLFRLLFVRLIMRELGRGVNTCLDGLKMRLLALKEEKGGQANE